MKIALYTGYHKDPWDPTFLYTTGLGGTEQCVLYLAKYLAFAQHEVWVVGNVIPGEHNNVKYVTTKQFKQEVDFVDTIIAASYIHYLKEFEDFNYTNSIFWAHNTDYHTWWNGEEIPNHRELLLHPKLQYIVCLTYWHKDKWLEQFPETYNKILVIGNGVEPHSFAETTPPPKIDQGRVFSIPNSQLPKKNKNQFIYSSHAERGLSKVLEDWPSIKEQLPDATLKICTPEYGLQYFKENFKSLILNLEDVEFLGTLPQQELYQLMAKSQYWYYPSSYEETFCITALEMLGHKVIPITWEWGGLKETLKGFNVNKFNETLDWNLVKTYISYNNWRRIAQTIWIPVLTQMNMNLDRFYVITLKPGDNQPLYEKCINITLPQSHVYYLKEGFNGLNMSQEELDRFGVKKHPRWKIDNPNRWYNREVTDGEIGCALSHVDVWVDAYCIDREITMILEEDFTEKYTVPWDDVQTLLNKGYDLIYLGRNAIIPDCDKPIKGLPNWVEPDYSYNAHAYILSRRGVQILVEEYIDQYKNEMFAIDEFLPITYGMTYRQDILAEYKGKTRLKVAAPVVNFITQENSSGVTNLNKGDIIKSEILQADDWDLWCKKYINPHILKGQHRLMTDEIGPNIIEFPLFTEKFCTEIIILAENNEWVTNRHTYHPTTDQTLESLGIQEIYQKVLEQFVYPIWIKFWELDGEEWSKLKSENFIAKYDILNQGSLDIHHDASLITLNVRLNNDFKGGGTYLPRYKKTLQPKKSGNAMAHPGSITHKHGGRPVEEGTRYILVTFTQTPK